MRYLNDEWLRLLRPYNWSLILLAILGFTASIAEGIGIGLLIPMLYTLTGEEPSGSGGSFAHFMANLLPDVSLQSRLAILGFAILVLIGTKTLILASNLALATRLAGQITFDLRMAACRQLLHIGYGFFSTTDHGKLLNLMDAQTYRTSESVLWLEEAIINVCSIAVLMTFLFFISWQMTVIAIALLVPAFFVVRQITRTAQRRGEALVNAYSTMSGRILELLNAMRTIRIFGQEEAEERRFKESASNLFERFRETETLNRLVPPLAELLYAPAFLVVFAYAWSSGTSIPVLLVFLLLLYRIQPLLKRLDQARVVLASMASSISEITELIRAEDKIYIRSGSMRIESFSDEIVFDQVSFRYAQGDSEALRRVSFAISKGSVVAIAGKSGSGKSTIVNLLCRFYDPNSGSISIDGKHLSELDLKSWRQRLAFAGQDADLISGSIRENVIFGHPGATDKAVRESIEVSHASEFIDKLPEGLETKVGSRGLRLSGGQRQRVALARALIRKPDILILDEATNAVDNVTEEAIQEAIKRLADESTVLVIAHNLNTLRIADWIVVMSDGKVVEQGAPQELLGKRGVLSGLAEFDADTIKNRD